MNEPKIKLPDKEYIHYVKDGKIHTVCTMRQKALHTIGMDNRSHHQPYTRHGRKFYRPYRNYFSAPKAGDKDLEKLADAGYMAREVFHTGTDRECVWYSFNRDGLDWLGEQLGIHIWDEAE